MKTFLIITLSVWSLGGLFGTVLTSAVDAKFDSLQNTRAATYCTAGFEELCK